MRMLLPIHYYRKRRRNLLGQAYNILCLWSFSLQKSLRHKQHVSWSPWVPVCVSFSVLKDGARFWKYTPQFVLYLMLKCPPVVANREKKKETFLIKKAFIWCVCFTFVNFLMPILRGSFTLAYGDELGWLNSIGTGVEIICLIRWWKRNSNVIMRTTPFHSLPLWDCMRVLRTC